MTLWGRFSDGSEIFYGCVDEETVCRMETPPRKKYRTYHLKDIDILPPAVPAKIIAVGLNFADHAAETGAKVPTSPLIWLKSPGSLLPHGGEIRIAYPKNRTDHEVELAIVIGRRVKNVPRKKATAAIFGYTVAQDISDRVIQRSEGQWARAKSFDTYTPLGPWIDTKFKPEDQEISMWLNGECRQRSTLDRMVFKPAELVSFISQHMTLEPGDVILTGTPPGVGPIRRGDRLEARIGGLAPLKNTVG